MKFIGIAGSPRQNKSSKFLLEQCFDELAKTAEEIGLEVETEIIDLAGKKIAGCIACGKCQKELVCSQNDDFVPMIEKLADENLAGLVIASPVYMGSMTAQVKAFIDRSVMFRRNGFLFRGKLGGVIAVGGSRNGGQELTCQAIHAGMMIHDMLIVGNGGNLGGAAWGNYPEGYENDSVGVATAQGLGARLAVTAMKMNG